MTYRTFERKAKILWKLLIKVLPHNFVYNRSMIFMNNPNRTSLVIDTAALKCVKFKKTQGLQLVRMTTLRQSYCH